MPLKKEFLCHLLGEFVSWKARLEGDQVQRIGERLVGTRPNMSILSNQSEIPHFGVLKPNP
jgi:hypothetical protein